MPQLKQLEVLSEKLQTKTWRGRLGHQQEIRVMASFYLLFTWPCWTLWPYLDKDSSVCHTCSLGLAGPKIMWSTPGSSRCLGGSELFFPCLVSKAILFGDCNGVDIWVPPGKAELLLCMCYLYFSITQTGHWLICVHTCTWVQAHVCAICVCMCIYVWMHAHTDMYG